MGLGLDFFLTCTLKRFFLTHTIGIIKLSMLIENNWNILIFEQRICWKWHALWKLKVINNAIKRLEYDLIFTWTTDLLLRFLLVFFFCGFSQMSRKLQQWRMMIFLLSLNWNWFYHAKQGFFLHYLCKAYLQLHLILHLKEVCRKSIPPFLITKGTQRIIRLGIKYPMTQDFYFYHSFKMMTTLCKIPK